MCKYFYCNFAYNSKKKALESFNYAFSSSQQYVAKSSLVYCQLLSILMAIAL